MADIKRSRSRPPRKSAAPYPAVTFRPGKSGVCEAQLWQFSGPSRSEEIPVERVAAGSLDEALTYIRRRYPGFIIVKAEALGMIRMLSGAPCD